MEPIGQSIARLWRRAGDHPPLAYAMIAAAVAAAWAFHAVAPSGQADFSLLPFLLPVLLGAALAGFAGGSFATLLGLAAGALAAGADATGANVAHALLFLLVALAVAGVGERMRRHYQDAEAANVELRAREARLQSIMETAPDAIIVIDEGGLIQSFSATAERMFGWRAEEVIGANVDMLMPEPDHSRHDRYISRYLETGEKRIIGLGRIVTAKRRDGATFPIELAIGEVQAGGRRCFTGFIRDISRRQRTEARLQELQSELVHVSRLTALGEMASALAHELNQPLSAISNYLKGSVRLLEESVIDAARIRDAVDKAGDQALRAGEIIRRLRDFVTRREAEASPQSLRKIIEEASALALVGLADQGVRHTFSFDESADCVEADRVQIQQVLINLIRNATDAMSEMSTRDLTISVAPHGEELTLVCVADRGPGVVPEIAPRLFQPFVTSKPDGMGVGLSISRTIVENHGGKMWFEANPTGGALFKFTLPRCKAASAR